jgi:hypothetical protein
VTHPHVNAFCFSTSHIPFHFVVVHAFTTHQRPEYVLPGLSRYDVALGRGTGVNLHVGNRRFRRIVREYAAAYLALHDGEKQHLVDEIVALVQQPHGSDAGGRFYERDAGGAWREVTVFRARLKCQALLRDYALRLRRSRAAANQGTATMLTTTPSESAPGTPRHEPSVVAVPAAVVTPPQESSPAVMSAIPAPSLPFAPLLASFSSSSLAVTFAGGDLPISSHTTTAGGWTSPVPPTTSADDVDDPAMIAAFLVDSGIMDLPHSSSSSSSDNGNGQELVAAEADSSTPPPPPQVFDDPLWSHTDYPDEQDFAAFLLDVMVDDD